MFTHRLRNLIVMSVFVIVIALTVREASAAAGIRSQKEAARNAATSECSDLPSRYSIHIEHVTATGTGMTYTEYGPTGEDGGLNYLYTKWRECAEAGNNGQD